MFMLVSRVVTLPTYSGHEALECSVGRGKMSSYGYCGFHVAMRVIGCWAML